MNLTRREAGLAGLAAVAATSATTSVAAAGAWTDEHDLIGLAKLVATRQASARELLDGAIERAEAANPRLNFLAQKLYDYGHARIAAGLPAGPFTGVPFLVKDLHLDIAGQRTGDGSRFWNGYVASETSELARRYERAGLVIFGKTTCPELGLTATTESVAYGVTRNPWNLERTTGGSSGGSAAAVAAGVVPAAHASDGGGSIRIPSSCCGLFGLKPSRGRVPMGPHHTEGWFGMSTVHAVTRSVRDSAALLDATWGLEPGSRYGAPTPERSFLESAGRDPRPLRIALVLSPPAGVPVDPECVEAARAAARLCERLGHHVEEAQPKLDAAAMGEAAYAEIPTALAADLQDRSKASGRAIGPDVVETITLALYELGLKASGVEVAKANNTLQEVAWAMADFMTDHDVILSPTLASPPVKLGVLALSQPDIATWGRAVGGFTPFTGIYNYTGQPSMSVPLAMSKDGLPIGVMFSGRYGAESTLFALAGQLERAAPWARRRPKSV